MRFSIKWLLAATAYAAIACASVAYASDAWNISLRIGVLFFASTVVVAGLVARGATRAFCIGATTFVISGHLFSSYDAESAVIHFLQSKYSGPTANQVLDKWLQKQIQIDERVADAAKSNLPTSREFVGVRRWDSREIVVRTTQKAPEDPRMNRGSGDYLILMPESIARELDWVPRARVAIKTHLILLFSLLGGLLGLWFWKREERARATTTEQVP